MSRTNLLLVLIVRDAALRSTLTAQLSLAGHELVTASEARDPGMLRPVRRRAALVIDEPAIATRSQEWAETLLADWWRVVVLAAGGADGPGPDADDPWLSVDAAALPATLAALAALWRTDPPRGEDRS